MELKITKIRDVKTPHRAHPSDAGIDFFVPNDFQLTHLYHGESVLIPSGVKVDVRPGWALVFMNKSGIAAKRGLVLGACVIDHGYKGEVIINLHNISKKIAIIEPGEKIVQGVMLPVGQHVIVETTIDNMWLDYSNARGEGGFGSSGTS